MGQKFQKTLFIITLAISALLLIQTVTSFIHLKALRGEFVKTKMPAFTFAGYMDGSFQKGFEDYGKDHFAFNEWLIPLHNQYQWDFYKKIEHKDIIFGHDYWLFFYEMLQDQHESLTYKYSSNAEEMAAVFEKDARTIYYLQEILKEYGTTLFVCIGPSKNELFPELLPQNTLFFRKEGIHADDFYVKRFRELGVNCLDLNSIYKSIKQKADYPLFYKASSHYSHISATYSADTLIKFMEEKSKLNIQNFNFGQPYRKRPKDIDRDLENLFNLIRPIEHIDYYYVDIEPIPDNTAVKPRWLTIGDSFYWNISDKVREAGIFESTPFWYYSKEVYFDDGGGYAENYDIVNELLTADIVMILWCPINLYQLEHNFANRALLSLCIKDGLHDIMVSNIKNDPEWYNSVVEKAKERNKDIEEMINIDADWMNQQLLSPYYTPDNCKVPDERNPRIAPLRKCFDGQSPDNICKIKHAYRKLKKENANATDEVLLQKAISQLHLN